MVLLNAYAWEWAQRYDHYVDPVTLPALAVAAVLLLTIAVMSGWLS